MTKRDELMNINENFTTVCIILHCFILLLILKKLKHFDIYILQTVQITRIIDHSFQCVLLCDESCFKSDQLLKRPQHFC
jgi:hypothetical protein